MQRPNEEKRRKIILTAARLFATRSFHEVRLDDIAAAAKVGKGTLYIYFKSKQSLYLSLIHASFSRLLEELQASAVAELPPRDALSQIVHRLVAFASSHSEFFELLRTVQEHQRRPLAAMRRRLVGLIERSLRRGIRNGIWSDPRPRLTAVVIPGMVRSAMLHGPRDMAPPVISSHILELLERGLIKRKSK